MTTEDVRAAGPSTSTPVWALLLVAAALGAAVWAAWLGWDRSYYTDASGQRAGPYTATQVIGCAATVGVVTAVLGALRNPFIAAGGVTLGFWLVWTVDAATQDDSGLFAVGSVLLLLGLVAGTSLAASIGYAAGAARRRRGARHA